MLIFILVSGWMTTYKNIDIEGNIEMNIILFLVSVTTHIVFGGLIFFERDAYHKYHDFSGIVGFFYIVLKLIMVAFCAYFYKENRPILILTSYILDEWNR